MEAVGRKEKTKKKRKEKGAHRLEDWVNIKGETEGQEEEEGAKEEAPGAGYELDDLDLDGGGSTVGSGSRHEDDYADALSVLVKSMEELGYGQRDSQQEHQVTTCMRGTSAEEVAERVRSQPSISQEQETTVGPVVCIRDQEADTDSYEIVSQLSENVLDSSVQELRAIGCGQVLVSPLAQACVASSHEAVMGVTNKKEKGKGKDDGVLSLKHGERDSQEHKLQAPGASEMASASMPLVSPSHQLFHGREQREHREIRLGLPSNRRMVDETLSLLKDCGLPVKREEGDSPQQYVATIPQLPNVEVCFHRPNDIVNLLVSGHLDIGIVSSYAVSECERGNDDLITVHNALGYGHCRLTLEIPKNGIFERINSVKELAQMPQWTEENPLRVVTGLPNLGNKFMQKNGPKHVNIVTGEGALEGFPQRRRDDVILYLVSSETTLRANNLKEIEGGTVLVSQAVLVASRKSLIQWEDVRDTIREIVERVEAHLKADGQLKVTAYMSGSSVEEVAERVLSQPSLSGLQNPAVCQVFRQRDGKMVVDCYAIDICVPERVLDSSVQQLRAMAADSVQTRALVLDGQCSHKLQTTELENRLLKKIEVGVKFVRNVVSY